MSFDLSQLISDLSAADAGCRRAAAESLCQHAESAAGAAVPLVRACGDEDETVREHAVAALESLGEPNGDDLTELAALGSHDQPDIAYWAITLLGRSGEAAHFANGKLAAILEGKQPLSVRERAAWALGKLGPLPPAARQSLQHAASGQDERLRRLAAAALETQ